ncbi:hypothetical protein ERO13_A09G134500v2 [Gossypium hirsutum]|uniref:Protein CHROMOSOME TRANSMISSION FIDELITY 7 isoform X2 n=1 Tax=Gossypium hirsutum TaxID=3635 RepID=A0ABM2YPX3_GOSHI|nr:protein CHROMOSOME TRANSMISSION FIDELITY 7 isoform X2 [Gossypium hirsutum]KAG4183840.1 hypothetical protein ERO13_A09G134500v2 [Gossypium hirsutum]
MQSKINSFFKPPSSSLSVELSNSPPVFSDDENDELATWEKSQHTIVNTYTRRPSNFNGNDKKKESGDDKFDKPISETRVSRDECGSNGRNLNKKRSYAQFHLELGQSDFLLHACSICGVKYSPVDEADERNHSIFHKNFTLGVQFKVYLFISSQRIAGCLVAEPIKEAFEVLSYPVGERQDGAIAKRRSNPSKLQFGEIVLEREVIKRAPSEVLHENHTGAILCKKEAVHAVCGIRAIWVTPSNRRKGIATQLLEAVRKSFSNGYVTEKSLLAFSQPSSDGQALASNYIGTRSFLVYKTGNLCR